LFLAHRVGPDWESGLNPTEEEMSASSPYAIAILFGKSPSSKAATVGGERLLDLTQPTD
jgi:hypothetical protein